MIYVLENGNKEERIVITGLSTLTEVEIVEGLEEGQEVVLVKKE